MLLVRKNGWLLVMCSNKMLCISRISMSKVDVDVVLIAELVEVIYALSTLS